MKMYMLKTFLLSLILGLTLFYTAFAQTKAKPDNANLLQAPSPIAKEAGIFAKEYYKSVFQVCDGKILGKRSMLTATHTEYEIIQILEPSIAVLPNQKTDDIAKLNHIEWNSRITLSAKAYRSLNSKNPETWSDWRDAPNYELGYDTTIEKRNEKWVNMGSSPSRVNCEELVAERPSTPQEPMPKSKDLASDLNIACPNSKKTMVELQYPRAALRDGITGSFIVEFEVGKNGEIEKPIIVGSANPYLAEAALNAIKQFKCIPLPPGLKVQAPFSFKLE